MNIDLMQGDLSVKHHVHVNAGVEEDVGSGCLEQTI